MRYNLVMQQKTTGEVTHMVVGADDINDINEMQLKAQQVLGDDFEVFVLDLE
jgi:hypothetical protein